MNKPKIKKIIKLITLVIVFGLAVGCAPKKPIHNEIGKSIDIVEQISDDCIKNKDTQGAKDAWNTYLYLNAFYCQPWTDVKYDDVKNRKYENIEFDMGELQIAVAAYNEYNEESEMDIDADWICHYNACTQEQHDAIDAYVEWFHHGQYVTKDGQVADYSHLVESSYYTIVRDLDIDLDKAPVVNDLSPAQFKEVQNYIADPENYQVNVSLWE